MSVRQHVATVWSCFGADVIQSHRTNVSVFAKVKRVVMSAKRTDWKAMNVHILPDLGASHKMSMFAKRAGSF